MQWEDTWIHASYFPDKALTFAIPEDVAVITEEITVAVPDSDISVSVLIEVPVDFPLDFVVGMIYALNSSDHYFDPDQPTRTAEDPLVPLSESLLKLALMDMDWAGRSVRFDILKSLNPNISEPVVQYLAAELKPTRRTFAAYSRTEVETGSYSSEASGVVITNGGTDGTGYNAVSSILFYLNGRADGDATNPSGLSPTKGFLTLAREEQYEDAAIALGCAAHYVGDLFSAGHSDWDVIRGLAYTWNSEAPMLECVGRHNAFDTAGDKFFSEEVDLDKVDLVSILSFGPKSNVCEAMGGHVDKVTLDDWNADLPKTFLDVARESQKIFKGDYAEDGPRNEAHLCRAVAVTAGVIDWAFSCAAEADEPYERDATNFFGMATGLLESEHAGAVISAGSKKVAGSLGKIDQDDYFPFVSNSYRTVRIHVDQGAGGGAVGTEIKAEAYDVQGRLIGIVKSDPEGQALVIDLGEDPKSELLVRVYSPNGAEFEYSLEFPEPKHVIEVQPNKEQIVQGETLLFSGSVRDEKGVGVGALEVTIHDPTRPEGATIVSVVTDEQGRFEYEVPTWGVKPFGYEFKFVAPGVEEPEVVRVSVKPSGDEDVTGLEGMLDVVFVIDMTGSMADDIEMIKLFSTRIIGTLTDHCGENNISLQIGLVTYGDHVADAQAGWLQAWPMRENGETIREAIESIEVSGGGDYAEDQYAALMCAMDARPDGQGNEVAMGWREGAAKITIPMCDGPPHEPDFEGRDLDDVAQRAEDLDPVHMYPLVTPRQGSVWLDGAVAAMERLADATDGKLTRIESADKMPEAIVSTVKLAIRRHKEEVWRKTNPPYVLYGVGAGIGVLLVMAVMVLLASNRGGQKKAPAAAGPADSRLTGGGAFEREPRDKG